MSVKEDIQGKKLEAVKHLSGDSLRAIKKLIKLLGTKKNLKEQMRKKEKEIDNAIEGVLEYIRIEVLSTWEAVKNGKKKIKESEKEKKKKA